MVDKSIAKAVLTALKDVGIHKIRTEPFFGMNPK